MRSCAAVIVAPTRDDRVVAFAIARRRGAGEQKQSSGGPPRRDRVPRETNRPARRRRVIAPRVDCDRRSGVAITAEIT
jgi:hypothetical protein